MLDWVQEIWLTFDEEGDHYLQHIWWDCILKWTAVFTGNRHRQSSEWHSRGLSCERDPSHANGSWGGCWGCRLYFTFDPWLFNSFVCFFSGPPEDQQQIEPHHTVVLEDGDFIRVENKVLHKNLITQWYTHTHTHTHKYNLITVVLEGGDFIRIENKVLHKNPVCLARNILFQLCYFSTLLLYSNVLFTIDSHL